MRDEDNKALDIGFQGEKRQTLHDNISKLFKRIFSNRRWDPRYLAHIAGLYDPVGLVKPVKQKKAIRVKKTFQEGGGSKLNPETLDTLLSEGLTEEAIQLFWRICAAWTWIPWGVLSSTEVTKPMQLLCIWGGDKSRNKVRFLSKATLHHWIQREKQSNLWSCLCNHDWEICWKPWMDGWMDIEQCFHLVDISPGEPFKEKAMVPRPSLQIEWVRSRRLDQCKTVQCKVVDTGDLNGVDFVSMFCLYRTPSDTFNHRLEQVTGEGVRWFSVSTRPQPLWVSFKKKKKKNLHHCL